MKEISIRLNGLDHYLACFIFLVAVFFGGVLLEDLSDDLRTTGYAVDEETLLVKVMTSNINYDAEYDLRLTDAEDNIIAVIPGRTKKGVFVHDIGPNSKTSSKRVQSVAVDVKRFYDSNGKEANYIKSHFRTPSIPVRGNKLYSDRVVLVVVEKA
ncbi:MAG: hypothetical protein AABW49_00025 [Nanoarchaeota archaeon]